MGPDRDPQLPDPFRLQGRALGCGCTLPFTGVVLLTMTIVLAVVIARDEDLRRSPLWLVLVPLAAGLFALYFRVRRYRGPP